MMLSIPLMNQSSHTTQLPLKNSSRYREKVKTGNYAVKPKSVGMVILSTNSTSDVSTEKVPAPYDITAILTTYKNKYQRTRKTILNKILLNLACPHRCEFNTVDSFGNNSIMLAINYNLPTLALKILESFPDYNLSTVNLNGDTALTLACKNGLTCVARHIIKYPNCAVDAINLQKNTALLLACKKKLQSVAVSVVLCMDANLLGEVNNMGNTALIMACNNKLTKVALKLLKNPTSCGLYRTNLKGNTPFIIACANKLISICEKMFILLDKTKLNHSNENGTTALMSLLSTPDTKMDTFTINVLSYADKCDLGKTDNGGRTALILACKFNKAASALKILDNSDCLLNIQDNRGFTALAYACENCMEDVILKILTTPYVCGLHKITQDGYSILDIACKQHLYSVTANLLNVPYELQSAFITKNTLSIVCHGYTSELENVLKMLLLNPQKCRFNALINGQTILIDMCEKKMNYVALYFLSHVPHLCALTYVNSRGKNALIIACENNLENVALKILDCDGSCEFTTNETINKYESDSDSDSDSDVDPEFNYLKATYHKTSTTSSIDLYKKALEIACANCMYPVIIKILELIPNELNNRVNKYLDDPVLMALGIEDIMEFKAIKTQLNAIREYNDAYTTELNKYKKKSDCVICCEDDITLANHYCLTNCGHTMSMCDKCWAQSLRSRCPICRKNTNGAYVKAYVVDSQ